MDLVSSVYITAKDATGPAFSGSIANSEALAQALVRLQAQSKSTSQSMLVDWAGVPIRNLSNDADELGKKLGQIGSRSSQEATNARLAMRGLGNELGVAMPRFVATFLTQIGGVSGILSAAFAPIAVIGLLEILTKIPDAVQKMVDKIRGWDAESKKAFEESTKASQEWLKHALEMDERMRAISLIGREGMAKLNLELVVNSKNIDEVQRKLNDLVERRSKLASIIKYIPKQPDPIEFLRAGAENRPTPRPVYNPPSHVEVEKAKIEYEELEKTITFLSAKLDDLGAKQKEITAESGVQARKDYGLQATIAEQTIEQRKKVNIDRLTGEENAARLSYALGTSTMEQLTAALEAAEEKRYRIMVDAATKVHALKAAEAAAEGKPIGALDTADLAVEHMNRVAAVRGDLAKDQHKEEDEQAAITERHREEGIAQAAREREEIMRFLDGYHDYEIKTAERVAQINEESALTHANQMYQRQRELILAQFNDHQISAVKRIALMEEEAKKAQEVEERIAKAGLDRAKGTNNPEEIAKAQANLDRIREKWADTMAKLHAESEKALVQPFVSAMNQIASAFNSGISAMIEGHKRFSQAATQVWHKLMMDAISAIESAAERYIIKHVIMAVAHKLFTTQNAATDTAGAATSIGTNSAKNVAQATGDAGLAAAGAFSSVMTALPFPLNVTTAPIVAGAALAQGLGYASVASAAGGADLPGMNMAVFTHPREMILPAPLADVVRRAAGGGTGGSGVGDTHNHYHGYPGESPDSISRNMQAFDRMRRDGRLHPALGY